MHVGRSTCRHWLSSWMNTCSQCAANAIRPRPSRHRNQFLNRPSGTGRTALQLHWMTSRSRTAAPIICISRMSTFVSRDTRARRAAELAQDLAGPVNPVVLLVDSADLGLELGVPQGLPGGRAALGILVCRRGDRSELADRFDAVAVLVSVDVGGHLLGRRSSSAPQKAAADLRISLPRRASRFSRSRALSRSRSFGVSPGRFTAGGAPSL